MPNKARRVPIMTVIYMGHADVYINFPTKERPDGYTFQRDVPVDLPAAMWPLLEVTELFERLGDAPPVELPSVPDSVVDGVPAEPLEPLTSGPGEEIV